jgi:protein-S-isoprenylcysteine O-methyltransferase Ste14
MDGLDVKAMRGLGFFVVALAVLIFLPAGTLNYWQGWVYLALVALSTSGITLHLMRQDRNLLAHRVAAGPRAERDARQKSIQGIAQFTFAGLFVVSSLDHRFGWSGLSSYFVVLGDLLAVLGLAIVFLVFRENSFTSAIIEVQSEQRVIETGPYARVRHPMYSGALVMLLGTPLALGSLWGLVPFLAMLAVITWRLLEEEKLLKAELPGYVSYMRKVRARLAPGLF